MNEFLKLILQYEVANNKLLQCVLVYLGVSKEDLEKELQIIKKEVEDEIKY